MKRGRRRGLVQGGDTGILKLIGGMIIIIIKTIGYIIITGIALWILYEIKKIIE